MRLKEVKALKAGLLPYYISGDMVQVCLMIPSDPKYGGSSPQISKGTIDPGEDAKEAAVREAEEELGLKRQYITDIWPIASEATPSKKNVSFFAAEVNSTEFDSAHYETGEVLWMNMSDAFKQIRPWQKGILGLFWKNLKNKNSSLR